MDFLKTKFEGRQVARMFLDGIIVGIFAGLISVLYRFILASLEKYRYIFFDGSTRAILAILIVFPIFAIIITKLLKWAPLSGGSGIPQIRGEVIGRFDMDENKTIVSKLVGGSLGAFAGLSLGREGPSIQLGGSIGKVMGKLLKRDEVEMSFMVTAGASAGLAAAFNAPISGTLFALEEVHKSFSRFILVPCIIASVIANYVSYTIMGFEPSLSFRFVHYLPLNKIYIGIIIGIFSGIVGVIFNKGLVGSQKLYKKLDSLFVRILIALGISAILGYTIKEVLGGGHGVLEEIAKSRLPLMFLVQILVFKLIFTWTSYGSGAQGGIFLPVLVIGGVTGAIVYYIFKGQVPEEFYVNFVILGMCGVLTSVVRAPIMSILLVSEMTGSFAHLIFLTTAAMVSFLVAELMENPPIYESLYEGIVKSQGDEITEDNSNYKMYEYNVEENGKLKDKLIKDISFPVNLMIVEIDRGTEKIVPKGDTKLMSGDKLLVIAPKGDFYKVDEYFKD